jgi:hypothetical protein
MNQEETTMGHTTPADDHPADGTWPGHEHQVPVPNTSMLPGTEQVLPAVRGPLCEAGGAWAAWLRGTVRSKPLFAVAAALALGALVTHFARARR